jgi:hypothetical protein
MKGDYKLDKERRVNFLGAYFNKDLVLRISGLSKIFSWVVVGIYGLEWLVQILSTILQISRGFWTGMGVTDILLNILLIFEQPLRGVVYFVVLQGVAQALLLFMDMEDNTRRAARSISQK